METLALEWATLLLRGVHIVTGIAWIGASFYFIWLDLSLEAPAPEKAARGLAGELWAIHGGGIYEVGKYRLKPPQMPERLHWFKWEAYSTWLSGVALLAVIYYLQPAKYLIGAASWLQTPAAAIVGSVAYLLGGLACYEAGMRSRLAGRQGFALAAGFAFLVAASWLAFELFAPRAAVLHVGALLATIMAGNVFHNIIPAQRALVAAAERGETPNPARAIAAKQRSTHNNYFTLPVVFCMICNHAAFVYAAPHSWLLTPAFAAALGWLRHYFNLKHQGAARPAVLAQAAIALLALAALTIADNRPSHDAASLQRATADAERVAWIVAARCATCHAERPSFPGYAAPAGGLVFATAADLDVHDRVVATSLRTAFMPLGNLTGMTADERELLIGWMDAGAMLD